jgi:hypothetical protein
VCVCVCVCPRWWRPDWEPFWRWERGLRFWDLILIIKVYLKTTFPRCSLAWQCTPKGFLRLLGRKDEAHDDSAGFGRCASVGISQCMLMCWTCGFVCLWICGCALNCDFSWLPSVESVLVHLGRHKNSIRQEIAEVSFRLMICLLRECICWVVTHPTIFPSSHPSITQVCVQKLFECKNDTNGFRCRSAWTHTYHATHTHTHTTNNLLIPMLLPSGESLVKVTIFVY